VVVGRCWDGSSGLVDLDYSGTHDDLMDDQKSENRPTL